MHLAGDGNTVIHYYIATAFVQCCLPLCSLSPESDYWLIVAVKTPDCIFEQNQLYRHAFRILLNLYRLQLGFGLVDSLVVAISHSELFLIEYSRSVNIHAMENMRSMFVFNDVRIHSASKTSRPNLERRTGRFSITNPDRCKFYAEFMRWAVNTFYFVRFSSRDVTSEFILMKYCWKMKSDLDLHRRIKQYWLCRSHLNRQECESIFWAAIIIIVILLSVVVYLSNK